jgi:hypothetical protein
VNARESLENIGGEVHVTGVRELVGHLSDRGDRVGVGDVVVGERPDPALVGDLVLLPALLVGRSGRFFRALAPVDADPASDG